MDSHGNEKIAALNRAIKINLKYQSVLREHVDQIEALLGVNSEKRRLVQQIIDRGSQLQRRLAVPRKAVFATPWFMDSSGNKPLDNADTIRKRRLRGNMPIIHKFSRWSEDEKRNLKLGIQHQNQAILMKRAVDEAKSVDPKSADLLLVNPNNSTPIIDAQGLRLKNEVERIKALPEEELLLNTDGIDWNGIASQNVRSRSAIDCKIQWMGVDDPRINHLGWSKEEDRRLLKLAEEFQGHDWVEIARRLDTNRTAMQCFQRFQRSLNSNFILSRWKQDEDKKLAEEVLKHGDRNWQQVASRMKMRTDQQCLHRWSKSVNPEIKSGRWSYIEDLRLRLAVKAYGKRMWAKIQRHVPGRTDVKCRERWCNVLDPELTKRKWTPEEDEKLMALAAQYGHSNWTKIAKVLAPRTDNQCWRRWKKLSEKPALDDYQKKLNIKRKSMVRNFVGRQKERTQLTADDIQALSLPVNPNLTSSPHTHPSHGSPELGSAQHYFAQHPNEVMGMGGGHESVLSHSSNVLPPAHMDEVPHPHHVQHQARKRKQQQMMEHQLVDDGSHHSSHHHKRRQHNM